jgi:hypothetical protein
MTPDDLAFLMKTCEIQTETPEQINMKLGTLKKCLQSHLIYQHWLKSVDWGRRLPMRVKYSHLSFSCTMLYNTLLYFSFFLVCLTEQTLSGSNDTV